MSDFIKTNDSFINLDHVIDFRIDGGKHRVTVEFSLSNGNTAYLHTDRGSFWETPGLSNMIPNHQNIEAWFVWHHPEEESEDDRFFIEKHPVIAFRNDEIISPVTPYTTHQNDSEIRYLHYPDNGYFSTPDDGIIVDVVEFMAHVKETSDNKRAEYLAKKSITTL